MNMVSARMGWAAARPEHAAAREISSDEVLIRRIAGGDQLAMQTLFARHRVALYRWLLRLVGDEALAEDLLSDVFLDVWRQAAKFEARSSVSTWLLAIARYKALSARRRRIDEELDEELPVIIADPADNPELVLQKKNQAELVRHPLSRLSPEHGGTHPSQSQSKFNPARDRRVGLLAIGQCLKEQYDALWTPMPRHLAALVEQLEMQK